jgi:hypothetical protein
MNNRNTRFGGLISLNQRDPKIPLVEKEELGHRD